MTSEKDLNQTLEKSLHTLEEICENTRAIRRVVNRILDHLHEQKAAEEVDEDCDPDEIDWDMLDKRDDMFS